MSRFNVEGFSVPDSQVKSRDDQQKNQRVKTTHFVAHFTFQLAQFLYLYINHCNFIAPTIVNNAIKNYFKNTKI